MLSIVPNTNRRSLADRYKLPILALMLALFLVPFRLLQAQIATSDAAKQFSILLTNDRVLSGQLSTESDRYVIQIAEGSNVIIPHEKVRFVGRNIRELYEFKVRSIQSMTPGDHYKLTRWCMANELLSEASEHYFEVKKDSPKHVRVLQLGEELKLKMLEDPGFRVFVGLPPQQPATLPTPKAPEPAPVVTVSAETEQMLDRLAHHPAVVRHYAERIQPILMNRCSQSGCHGGAQPKSSFVMLKPYSQNQSETTIANLRAVIQQIGSTRDQASNRLVQFATTPHGSQKKAGIAPHETKLLSELMNWFQLVHNPVVPAVGSTNPMNHYNQVTVGSASNSTVRPGSYSPAMTLMPVSPGSAQLMPVPKKLEHEQVITALENSLNAPAGISRAKTDYPDDFIPPSMEEIDQLDAMIRTTLGTQPPAPKDPFDPEEFNRMTPSTQQTQSTGSPPVTPPAASPAFQGGSIR